MKSFARNLLLILLMISITPMLFGELLTQEEIASLIECENGCTEEEVEALVWDIVQMADEEIKRTSEEAVKEAVIDLKVDVAGLQKELELLQKDSKFWKIAGIAGMSLGVCVVVWSVFQGFMMFY